jgi:peptide/nickel transport system permease protein
MASDVAQVSTVRAVPARRTARVGRFLRRDPLAGAAGAVLALILLVAAIGPLLSPYAYDRQDLDATLRGPSAGHPFGTDHYGRDIFARVAYGARISLAVAGAAVTTEVVLGALWGTTAGLAGGRTDVWMMRLVDLLIAFPSLLLAILITGIFGPSLVNIVIALVVAAWPGMARVVRSEVVALREREFVEAARALGGRTAHLIRRHLLPNVLHLVAARASLDVSALILVEATLSFVGVGVQPPRPSWGLMINEAFPYLRSQPYLLIIPALFLSLTVLALNIFGEALTDTLDPRRRVRRR